MKSFLSAVFILASVITFGQWGNSYQPMFDTEDSTGVAYVYSDPTAFVQIFRDTTYSYDYFEQVYYSCLRDENAVATTAQYVITADEWGRIQKVHVDSLQFSAPQESPEAPQQFNTEVAADYAIEKVEFLDVNNTAIDPTNGSAHYVRVKFTNGQTVTQPYIGRK